MIYRVQAVRTVCEANEEARGGPRTGIVSGRSGRRRSVVLGCADQIRIPPESGLVPLYFRGFVMAASRFRSPLSSGICPALSSCTEGPSPCENNS